MVEGRVPDDDDSAQPGTEEGTAVRASHARSLWVMVAGPYSASTTEGRVENFKRLQEAAREVLRRGHVPLIGHNNGLPLFAAAEAPLHAEALASHVNTAVNQYGLMLAERCDAVLRLGRSPGADAEVEFLRARGCPVFEAVEDLPLLSSSITSGEGSPKSSTEFTDTAAPTGQPSLVSRSAGQGSSLDRVVDQHNRVQSDQDLRTDP